MRVLVVACHPAPDSYGAALTAAVIAGAADGGHEVEVIDLAALGFDPVMSAAEWRGYADPAATPPDLEPHIAALRRAEALVLVFPIWWGGPPAQMKGWLDRVLRPGVGFVTEGATGLRPGLPQIRRLAAVTTLGSPSWVWRLLGQPGRRMVLRGLRPCIARRARTSWLALHSMDATTPESRARHLDRIRRQIARL